MMRRNMASVSLSGLMFCTCFLIMVSFSLAEASRVFVVGDEFGWRVPGANDTAFYGRWATSNRFRVGDSLSFEYQNDSVIEVDKWGYYHCNGSDSVTAFDNGNSTISLERPGPFYFISGDPNHCKNGQRLIVEVMHIHHQPIPRHSPPTIAAPPDQQQYSSSIAPSPLSNSGASDISAVFVSSVLLGLLSPFVTMLWCEP